MPLTDVPTELQSRPLMGDNSQYRTMALFINAPNKHKEITSVTARFALGVEDFEYEGILYPSFHNLFVATDDETGYIFAKTYLLGVPQFEELTRATWFIPHLEKAKREIALRRHSRNIQRLQEKAETGDVSALKYLIDCKHLDAPPDKPDKVGRPTKQRIQQGIDEALADDENLLEDYKRLGIDVSLLENPSPTRKRKRA